MHFSHLSIGGGIVGIETLISSINNIELHLKKKNKKFFDKKKISFAIIDSKPENIPGGVAYGFESSKYGFFNNPLRLSPNKLQKWIFNKKKQNHLVRYIEKYGGESGKAWLNENKKLLGSRSKKNFREIYFPRALANFWMEEKLIQLLKKINVLNKKYSIKIKVQFIKGEVIGLSSKTSDFTRILFKGNRYKILKHKIRKNNFKILDFKSNRKYKKGKIHSITQCISLGLPPPKELATKICQKNFNYIRDFYFSGGTANLINKLIKIKKKKRNKQIIIYFIGYKAGLLEPLTELKYLIKRKNINAKMLCSSPNLLGIQKAQKSKNIKKYKLNFFKKNKINKIKTSKMLLSLIIQEFNIAEKKGYNKYDAWTEILNRKILNKSIKNFNSYEKRLYKNFVFYKIRALTRFTYPSTIESRDELVSDGILSAKKETVTKVNSFKNKLYVYVKNKHKKYCCDLVVNVSGPLIAKKLKNDWPLIKSIKNKKVRLLQGGFDVDENFKVIGARNIYVPGFLANSFNPERKTIIKAILENSNKAGIDIAKKLLMI